MLMNCKGFGRKWSRPNFKVLGYPGIPLEGLRKTTKPLNQNSRSPGPRIEPGTSRIEAGMLTIRPRPSVFLQGNALSTSGPFSDIAERCLIFEGRCWLFNIKVNSGAGWCHTVQQIKTKIFLSCLTSKSQFTVIFTRY
jgi:hypothetical protein